MSDGVHDYLKTMGLFVRRIIGKEPLKTKKKPKQRKRKSAHRWRRNNIFQQD